MDELKMLVTYSSVHGSTAEVARAIALTLSRAGLEVDVLPVAEVNDVKGYDGVVLGSALYGGKWRSDAVDFLAKSATALSERDVWLFQSGPLGKSAQSIVRALPVNVSLFSDFVGARGSATFGGKLDSETGGPVGKFLARAGFAGDYRDFSEIREWAENVARETAMHVVCNRTDHLVRVPVKLGARR